MWGRGGMLGVNQQDGPPAPPALLINRPLCSPQTSEALNPALDVSKKWKSHQAAVPPWLLESF